jgi:hypothetical protein
VWCSIGSDRRQPGNASGAEARTSLLLVHRGQSVRVTVLRGLRRRSCDSSPRSIGTRSIPTRRRRTPSLRARRRSLARARNELVTEVAGVNHASDVPAAADRQPREHELAPGAPELGLRGRPAVAADLDRPQTIGITTSPDRDRPPTGIGADHTRRGRRGCVSNAGHQPASRRVHVLSVWDWNPWLCP